MPLACNSGRRPAGHRAAGLPANRQRFHRPPLRCVGWDAINPSAGNACAGAPREGVHQRHIVPRLRHLLGQRPMAARACSSVRPWRYSSLCISRMAQCAHRRKRGGAAHQVDTAHSQRVAIHHHEGAAHLCPRGLAKPIMVCANAHALQHAREAATVAQSPSSRGLPGRVVGQGGLVTPTWQSCAMCT